MKRSIRVVDLAGNIQKEITLSRSAGIRIKAKLFFLDILPDETWRINYSKALMEETSPIKSIDFENIMTATGRQKEAVVLFRGANTMLAIHKVVRRTEGKALFHLDHHEPSNTWTLHYHKDLIDDISNIRRLEFHRED